MAVFHIGALVAALFFFTWHRLMLFLLIWFITSSFGIGIGYHRLLTHKGFKTYKWLEYLLAGIAGLAQQGSAREWVSLHRQHHAHTEVPGLDPHTPREGKWWSHMDWILHPYPDLMINVPLVRDLTNQWVYRQRYLHQAPTIALGTLLLVFRGVPAVGWGVALPVVVGLHQTWLVNSGTHLWGYRWFETNDDSRNNPWIALFAWGEGWHNNHHRFQKSARHGLAWYEIDVNWYIIKFLRAVGLVWEVSEAKL